MSLKYVAAYNLALIAGTEAPTAALISKILTAGGVEAVDSEIAAFLAVVEGKNATELIESGRKTVDSVRIGGGAAAPAAAGAAPAAAAAAAPEPEEEEEAVEFDLF